VAHKKCPQLCSDAVRLNSRIQTKRNDALKEQSELNSTKNMTLYAFVLTVKYAKEYFVRNVQNNQ